MASVQNKLTVGTALVALTFAGLLVAGWIMNIVHIINGPVLSLWAGKEILQAIGVFIVPLGSLMGWVV